ncbi:hypothetical protein F6R98_00485 [Candidatus Methylospira mobilis]|uniref:Uncharacterized protein n=1 Tax=Candidatus Methylospira mobilis TaxID=1808979 RepID=A0A5Q0BGM9_9GAMM|nr:hypothetical protein [Candidatus Methylospira mobilis]QFY41278.1 hypothetical protein F6R98_00485 [Candidatus Methylospira mobilis]WNV05500.1 hypothetical protein RP726_03560 [Candidatus Methylospira mobilis]
MKTQETNIWYRQITTKVMEKIQLEANAMAIPKIGQQQTVGEVRLKKIKNAEPIKSIVNKLSDAQYSFINTIEYHTATAVWKPEGERLLLCKGSGRCYGQALLLNELIELGAVAQNLKPDKVSAKHEILANSLHITYNDLLAFFNSSDYRGFVPHSASQLNLNPWEKENFAAQVGCVLIESTFERNMLSSNLVLRKNRITPQDKLNIAPEGVLASAALPDVNPADKDDEYKLQSIRLRYRIADLKEDKSTPFKLGLYLPGTFELGIRLEEVENAGASGIVDIVTYWHGASSSGTDMYNRDQTVAATVLITQ